MVRLHFIVERFTEKKFVEINLVPFFAKRNIFIDVTCVLTSRDLRHGQQFKGGLSSYTKAKNHIKAWLKQDSNSDARFTTMFDLYALPMDFSGFEESKKIIDPYKRIEYLENYFKEDISDYRFFPYIQLYEFEKFLFVNPAKMEDDYFNVHNQIQNLISMKNKTKDKNPELINDSPENSPSKRILKLIPDYDKTNIGPLIVKKIGLEKIRSECHHFNKWIEYIETQLSIKHRKDN